MTTAKIRPDIILFNGYVATQIPHAPLATAVAVGQGCILAVGGNDDVLNTAGPETARIDLDGRLVVPGFIDTHIHFYEWALQRQRLKLEDVTSHEELLGRVHEAAQGLPANQWILGQGWNESDWTETRMPTRSALDQAAPANPVLLWRCDMHLAALNSVALELAGIHAGTPDPPEGHIDRDPTGAPNGILRELAINLVRRIITPPETPQVLEAFESASKALYRRGVTAIHDVRLMADQDGARAFNIFQELDQDDRLGLRCWVTLPGHHLQHIIALGLRTGFGNDKLRIGHVKFFSDGGMGARTAWMIDPYLDAGYGMPLMDMETLSNDIGKADAADLSVMVHAVGDRANRELVNIFETLEARRTQTGSSKPPIAHRMEHVQMIRPEDADRLGKLNVALCVTPANMLLDINLIDSAVGGKGRWTYALRRLIDTGAPVMFSSDCPVCDPDPLVGIHAAVTRQRSDGTPAGGWYPQNCVTVAEAIQAYTSTPAAVHRAFDLGVIAPGKKGDVVILSKNILTLPPSQIPKARVDMTIFNGRIVHRRF